MDPDRWQRVQEIFTAALRHQDETRATFVASACGEDAALRAEVLSLLRAHQRAATTTFMDSPAARTNSADLEPGAPAELGPYRLLRRLGGGGMGSVYLGLRADEAYQQRVAIKLLRGDLDHQELIQRFRRERQILAHLDHPNIAKLHDGGTAPDGRPYLVMEYVEGQPIDAYCGEHDLDIGERLRLFAKVCAAVHIAHQALVVHRDLKPANILVTAEGEPKLLDFGIAKLLAAEQFPMTVVPTMPGLRLMTPQYASPEQMRGLEVTTASDVYSLGILLYELLAGKRPFQIRGLPTGEALHGALEVTPARPSSVVLRAEDADGPSAPPPRVRRRWARQLEGDLDTIVLRAMAQEPRRRFPSADALARDVDRHLRGLPVTARGDSWSYRASRFVGRHRWAVTAIAIAMVGLVSLTLGLLAQRAETLRERDQAVTLLTTMVGIFENADPGRARGETITARQVLDASLPRIEALADQPALQSDLQVAVGRVFHSLALLPKAIDLLERALETRRALHRHDHVDVAESLELLGYSLHAADEIARAEPLLREAVAMRRGLHGDDHPEVARSSSWLATALHRVGRLGEARPLYDTAVKIRRRQRDPLELARALNALGTLDRDVEDHEKAEALHREALELLEGAAAGLPEPHLARTLTRLGGTLRRQGRYEEALASYERAEAMQHQLFTEAHPDLADTLAQRGLALEALDRDDEAEGFLQEALAMRRQVFGDEHARVADSLTDLAHVYRRRGDFELAGKTATQAVKIFRRVLRPNHKDLAASLGTWAQILVDQSRCEEAMPLYDEALAINRQWFGQRHRSVATMLNNMARCASARGELEHAIELRQEAVHIFRDLLGADHPDLAKLLYNLGVVYHHDKQFDRAAETYEQAMAIAEPTFGPDHDFVKNLRMAMKSALKAGGG